MENEKKPTIIINAGKNNKMFMVTIVVVAMIVIGIVAMVIGGSKDKEDKTKIITTTTLEEIIEVSELSTYQSIHNGVVTVMNEKKPEKVDYHVSYKATVKAGIDFEKVSISIDEDNKKVLICIPEVEIQKIDVDAGTMDFLFVNKKAETSSVSSVAYELCKKDVENENDKGAAIYQLAEENAKNAIRALIEPFLISFDPEYTIEFVKEGE